MTTSDDQSNTPSGFLRAWGEAALVIGGLVAGVALLAAPLIPALVFETWWSYVLTGVGVFAVISFFVALGEWL